MPQKCIKTFADQKYIYRKKILVELLKTDKYSITLRRVKFDESLTKNFVQAA